MGLNLFFFLSTLAYTAAATLAVGLHSLNLREALLNQHAIRRGIPDGIGEEVANMIVRIEASRLSQAVAIAALGYGVLIGLRGVGWSLIAIPVIGIYASWRDLQSRHRAAVLAEKLLAAQSLAAEATLGLTVAQREQADAARADVTGENQP